MTSKTWVSAYVEVFLPLFTHFGNKEDSKGNADHSRVHALVEEESLALKFVWSEVGHSG